MRNNRRQLHEKWMTMICLGCLVLPCMAWNVAGEETETELINEEVWREPASVYNSYSIPAGWQELPEAAAGGKVYKQSASMQEPDSSQICCFQETTDYSLMEYEQLRGKLTDQVVYEDSSAVVSSTCTYTEAQDNLFVLTSDDAERPYRDIYYYIVRDYEYFCFHVREDRLEAEKAREQQIDTPEEAGRKMASQFTW